MIIISLSLNTGLRTLTKEIAATRNIKFKIIGTSEMILSPIVCLIKLKRFTILGIQLGSDAYK
tara:strand:- start:660 stop:848 length:189 start_codon:yes stop_codon:yes gene_type:complete